MKGKLFSKFLVISVVSVLVFGGLLVLNFGKTEKAKADGNTFYVDVATGNNSDCVSTTGAPFASMIKAQECATDGDTILVKSGTYRESYLSTSNGRYMTFNKGITWQAVGSDWVTDGQVIMRGYAYSWNVTAGIDTTLATSPLVISNFIFDGESGDGVNAKGYGLYITQNSLDITLNDCTVRDVNDAGEGYGIRTLAGGKSELTLNNFTMTGAMVSGSVITSSDIELTIDNSNCPTCGITNTSGRILSTVTT